MPAARPPPDAMSLDPKTLLQIAILSVGAHIVLSFIRTTRGSGMIRGVLIALAVVFGLLRLLAREMGLAELQFIVDTLTGFVVVILAIVFQPELRRGIISIGDNKLLRTVMRRTGGDVTDEVAAACVAMAKRNQGALIAFERKVALDAWAQKAVRLDSRVSRHLLDSIFYPGGALHDGAVIIREDRVAAAQAILPLSEKENLARSIGTRHRAALGLSEETDAVVVAVSEETGLITVCQDGQMERRVLKDELAADLRARLGGEGEARAAQSDGSALARAGAALRGAFGRNVVQKLLALAFGVGIFAATHELVRETRQFPLRVSPEAIDSGRPFLASGALRIVLPSNDLHLVRPAASSNLSVRVTAAQGDLATIAQGIGGTVVVREEWIGAERELRVSDASFGVDRPMEGLQIEWVGDRAPTLLVERYAEADVEPSLDSLALGDRGGATPVVLASDVEVDMDSLEFDPPRVRLRGPADEIAAIRETPSRLVFDEIDLSKEAGSSFIRALGLDAERMGAVELEDALFLRGDLREAEVVIAQVELDVALVDFDATGEGPAPLERFRPPPETVTVRVKARGLIPEETDESTKVVMRQEVQAFVRANARVFVDVGRFDATRGRRLPVEAGSLEPLWREALGPAFVLAKSNPSATLELEIDERDRTIALEEREDRE